MSGPPESSIGAFLNNQTNWWLDEDGFEHVDLTDFGFTARQNQTIRKLMDTHPELEYLFLPNNNGDWVEIFWEQKGII